MLLFLPAGGNLTRRISPCYAIFSPYGVRAISIFYQFIQFLGTASDGEVERMFTFISSFHFLANPAKHPATGFRAVTCLPSSSAPPPPPSSRGGRPVSAGPIGKQRPKMYFPVLSLLPTSKHSHGSRKNMAGPQFLFTINSIAVAPRPPPRKFDKSQKL